MSVFFRFVEFKASKYSIDWYLCLIHSHPFTWCPSPKCDNVISRCAFGGSDLPWGIACIMLYISAIAASLDVSFSVVRTCANRVADIVAKFVHREGWGWVCF